MAMKVAAGCGGETPNPLDGDTGRAAWWSSWRAGARASREAGASPARPLPTGAARIFWCPMNYAVLLGRDAVDAAEFLFATGPYRHNLDGVDREVVARTRADVEAGPAGARDAGRRAPAPRGLARHSDVPVALVSP